MATTADDGSSIARKDAPAVIHLGVQGVATVACLLATLELAEANDPLRWVAVSLLGVCVLTFFPLLHEAGHQTAFASRTANEVGVWLGALAMLQAPSFFREFHWEHHRSTQDLEQDPEISGAPALLDGYPRDPLSYLFLVSGQFLMVGKLGFTIACALLPRGLWRRFFPFIRETRADRVVWESRAALLVFAAVGVAAVNSPAVAFALLAWPIAHLLLGFYLMPEHTGLPNDGSQIHRTRTIRTNALVRTLMWNMPYHAEHHASPGVPYHALPALHDRLAPDLEHLSSGYLAFHADAVLRALRLR
ncbi:MAG: fatty acid desaturase [bacterium]|nr:fatty acid desaturase [bacterium]